MKFAWHIVQVKSGNEKKAIKSILENAFKNGVEKYFKELVVPIEKTSRTKVGKSIKLEKKIYPGYIMVNINKTILVINVIRESKYVSCLMHSSVADSEFKRVKQSVEEGKFVSSLEDAFKVGENVKIVDGPFETFNGNIQELDMEKGRVKVIVNIFGRDAPVSLRYQQIRKNK